MRLTFFRSATSHLLGALPHGHRQRRHPFQKVRDCQGLLSPATSDILGRWGQRAAALTAVTCHHPVALADLARGQTAAGLPLTAAPAAAKAGGRALPPTIRAQHGIHGLALHGRSSISECV